MEGMLMVGGFVLCEEDVCVCVWVRREGKSEFGTRWTAFLYFFDLDISLDSALVEGQPKPHLCHCKQGGMVTACNGGWGLTEFQLSPPLVFIDMNKTRTREIGHSYDAGRLLVL